MAKEQDQYKKINQKCFGLYKLHTQGFFVMSPWENLRVYSNSCIINTGYADALWIKPRTLVAVLTKVAATLKSKLGIPN